MSKYLRIKVKKEKIPKKRFTTENPVWNLEIEEKSNIREEAKEDIKVNFEHMLDESTK